MAKFKVQDKIIECDCDNDVLPILLGKDTKDKKFNIEEAKEKYKGYKIFDYHTVNIDKDLNSSEETYYYIGAPNVNKKEYIPVSTYDGDIPEDNLLIETILQVENYTKKVYTNIKDSNGTMSYLLNAAIEDIYTKYHKGEKDYFTIVLYNKFGLDWEYGLKDKANIEKLISSIRIVEEIKNEEV